MKYLLLILLFASCASAPGQPNKTKFEFSTKTSIGPAPANVLEYTGNKTYYWTNAKGERKKMIADTVLIVDRCLIVKLCDQYYIMGLSFSEQKEWDPIAYWDGRTLYQTEEHMGRRRKEIEVLYDKLLELQRIDSLNRR